MNYLEIASHQLIMIKLLFIKKLKPSQREEKSNLRSKSHSNEMFKTMAKYSAQTEMLFSVGLHTSITGPWLCVTALLIIHNPLLSVERRQKMKQTKLRAPGETKVERAFVARRRVIDSNEPESDKRNQQRVSDMMRGAYLYGLAISIKHRSIGPNRHWQ